MTFLVGVFVLQFLCAQVRSATILGNVDQNGEEPLQDSSRLYLADHPNFENSIVGATMKKNLKKLCEQCKNTYLCRGQNKCKHCAEFCDVYGSETKENKMMGPSMEVEIPTEPEIRYNRNEEQKEMVSRFSGEGLNTNMAAGMDQKDRVQMVHQLITDRMLDEGTSEKDHLLQATHQKSRYYTVGVIKPGLLMNILLKLIKIEETKDIEKAIILVKSSKSMPDQIATEGETETQLLQILRKELETAERKHGNSHLEWTDINRILETAYEKGESKPKSAAHHLSNVDTIPVTQNENKTPHDDKIVSHPLENDFVSENLERSPEFPEEDMNGEIIGGEEKKNLMLSPDMSSEALGRSANGENSETMLKNALMGMDSEENFETEDENDDADTGNLSKENDKIRNFHKMHKYKKKKKKGHMQSSYGQNYYNGPYGYYRSTNDQSSDHPNDSRNQENWQVITGSQQESLRPHNEDRIGAKDDWQRDQKGFQFKGEGGLLQELEKNQKPRNNDAIIGSHQEHLNTLNRDRIGIKEGWQRDQKGFQFKGEGGLLQELEKSQKSKNDDMIGSQLEHLNDEDRMGAKEGWEHNEKGYISNEASGQLHNLEKHDKSRNNIIDNQQNVASPPMRHPDRQKIILEQTVQSPNELVNSHDETLESTYQPGKKLDKNVLSFDNDSTDNPKMRNDDGIPRIILTEKNRKLDPKEVQIAQPTEDNHDGMPDPFHTRIHAHFNKLQEYYNKPTEKPTRKVDSIVSMTEATNMQGNEDFVTPEIRMQARNNEDYYRSMDGAQMRFMPKNNQLEEETLRKQESTDVGTEQINDDSVKVGSPFQEQDSQMSKYQNVGEELIDEGPKVGVNIQPQDMIILQNQQDIESSNQFDKEAKSFDIPRNEETPEVGTLGSANNVIVADDLQDVENPMDRPQDTIGDENRVGQTDDQEEKQFVGSPQEGNAIFRVNNESMVAVSNEKVKEKENVFLEEGRREKDDIELLGTAEPSKHQRINSKVMKEETLNDMSMLKSESRSLSQPKSGKNPVIPDSLKEKQQVVASQMIDTADMQLSSDTETSEMGNEPFLESKLPTAGISPVEEHPFAPTFVGFRNPNTIHTNEQFSERSSLIEKHEKTSENRMNDYKHLEIARNQQIDEKDVEKKIQKLITPKEQEFLHNFGKIVPSIEKIHLNSKSDIYFVGNGIKLPLKMLPNDDGTISLSVDLHKLCDCKNSTCAHKIDVNKLDEQLIGTYGKNQEFPNGSDIKHIADDTEKKIRKRRFTSNRRKLYHKLQRRFVPDEYMRRFKDIEHGLENKLDELNQNVRRSNKDYDNMLLKGTKDLLHIKEEDQVVKKRILLVNDLLKWMKDMASKDTSVGVQEKNNF